MREKKIVIACGYGCKLHARYKEYLIRVANYVNTHGEVSTIIVSGGPTQQKSFPNTSEAAVMRAFLETLGRVYVPIIEDHEAFTSYTNMSCTLKIVNRLGGGPDDTEIVVFCDAVRALKLKVIAEGVFKGYRIVMETHDLAPPGTAKWQVIPSLIDILATYVPPVNLIKEGIRKLQARTR